MNLQYLRAELLYEFRAEFTCYVERGKHATALSIYYYGIVNQFSLANPLVNMANDIFDRFFLNFDVFYIEIVDDLFYQIGGCDLLRIKTDRAAHSVNALPVGSVA